MKQVNTILPGIEELGKGEGISVGESVRSRMGFVAGGNVPVGKSKAGAVGKPENPSGVGEARGAGGFRQM